MSDIVTARELVKGAIVLLQQAHGLMQREKAVKRAPAKRVRITAELRQKVKKLAAAGKSHHEIAQAVGLGNGGRVSEILTGKR
jgi:hypothetical protein